MLRKPHSLNLQKTHRKTENEFSLSDIYPGRTFYLTSPTLCSYLPEKSSQLFYTLIPNHKEIDPKSYTFLVHNGFHRSGHALHKPYCPSCQQCVSSRVIIKDFKFTRRFRKVLNRNSEVTLITNPAQQKNQEYYDLYQKYIIARHVDGDMYPPSLHTFEQFLINNPTSSTYIEMREPSGKLIAVAVTDLLEDGLSSIYTFYDPIANYNSRSLGVFCILKQILVAKSLGLAYLYLGYWIPTFNKMSYKTNYLPIELYINNHWQRFDETPDTDDIVELLNTKKIQVFF